MTQTNTFSGLQGYQYMNLTTFRKNGDPVLTPVWFAQDGDRLYVVTQRNAGKLKRIRNNPRVQVGPSGARGEVRGPAIDAIAQVLPPGGDLRAKQALDAKYGILKQLFNLMWRLRRTETVHLEIVPAEV